MRYLIFNSLAQAQGMNTAINNYMKANVDGYNGTQWAKIITNNDNTKWAIPIKETDPRQPQNAMDSITKGKLVELDDTWLSMKSWSIVGIDEPSLNFVSE